MSLASCPFRTDLDAFVDGELDGARMLAASRHLDECDECAEALADMQSVGRALREKLHREPAPDAFAAMTATVVSLSRAESDESWRTWLTRGCDGWHWAIVGAGSVAATFVSTSLLSMMLAFGPAPQREDSLSALVDNLGSSSGYLFVYASPVEDRAGQDVVMLQVENGRPRAPRLVSDLVVSRSNQTASEAQLVNHLLQIVTHSGRIVVLDELSPQQREAADALLDEIMSLGARRNSPGRTYNVHEMRLVTSTGVSAKRL
jgi:hypothetical protein